MTMLRLLRKCEESLANSHSYTWAQSQRERVVSAADNGMPAMFRSSHTANVLRKESPAAGQIFRRADFEVINNMQGEANEMYDRMAWPQRSSTHSHEVSQFARCLAILTPK